MIRRLLGLPRKGPTTAGAFGLLTLLVLLALTGCKGDQKSGEIVYTSDENGSQDIYISSPSTNPRQLTDTPAKDHSPRLSPDGKWVAFVSEMNGNADIFMIREIGEDLIQMTDSPGEEFSPRWSPDGKMLAFLSRSDDGNRRIFITAVDQPRPHRLTTGDMDEGTPSWSPDGQWIAFSMADASGTGLGIFLRNPGGVNQIPLTNGPDYLPTWAPDGRSIAFQSTRSGNGDIYAVTVSDNAVSGEPRRLTNHPTPDYGPTWSPKGDWIAFISERDGNPEVYIISPDGTIINRLTFNQAVEEGLSWSGDGRLVFVSDLHGNADIFIMDSEGGNQLQVTLGLGADTQPHR